jgi:ATP-binding cassette subfamily F protein 3
MLIVTDLYKSFGDATVLEKVSFTLARGERAGLIGPNGSGKTTLVKIIAGIEQPDKGKVWLEPSARFGYLAQALEYAPGATVGDVIAQAIGPAFEILQEIERLALEISQTLGEEFEAVMARYSEALEAAERLDAYGAQARLKEVLDGLDLSHLEQDTPVAILSGGQKTRLGLARLLLSRPELLLLDEPTNHLDITALDWLVGFVRQYRGAVLVVSHDRNFLDRVVTKLLVLDENIHTMSEFVGTYSEFAEAEERRRQKYLEDYQRQQEYIARVESDISKLEGTARRIEHETINFYVRKRALKVARRAVVRRKKLEKLLDSEEKLEKPRQGWHMKLEFENTPTSGQMVLSLDNVAKSFGPLKLFERVTAELRQGERVALLGPNGTGKTTLLKIIAGELKPDSGTSRLGANVRVGYFSQEQEGLKPQQSALEAVREVAAISETEARNFMHFFLFSGDEVFTPVGSLSFGERARLVLARLVLSGVNFLLLDEPLNHLDIKSRVQFEEALENFEGTILAVAHDRYFVENFAERIWAIENGTLKNYYDLEDYEKKSA